MGSHISLNVLGDRNISKERLLLFAARAKPTVMVVMQNSTLAAEIKFASPQTNVIYRHWPDDNIHLRYSPEQYLDACMQRTGGNKSLTYYTCNEPSLNRSIINWHVKTVEKASPRGIKLCVLDIATGNPEPSQWIVAEPLLYALRDHPEHVLGLHEYAGGIITSGFTGGTPTFIKPEQWPQDISKITLWHMGRFKFLLEFCEKRNIKPPRIVITETGFDDTSDIKDWLNTLKHFIDGTENSIRGWKSLFLQWKDWFPDWTAERAYYEQLAYADRVIYRPYGIEGQCIFSYGTWKNFGVDKADELLSLIEKSVTPDEPPQIPPIPTAPSHTLEETISILKVNW